MKINKFRAWEKSSKIMCGFDTLDRIIANFHGLSEEEWNDLVWMNYAGFKDINGIEIYTADIVKHKNGFIYIVEFSNLNHWFCLVQLRQKDTPYTGGINGQEMRYCEFIGSFYENPELLKDCR